MSDVYPFYAIVALVWVGFMVGQIASDCGESRARVEVACIEKTGNPECKR